MATFVLGQQNNVNTSIKTGATPLLVSVVKGNKEIIKLLLEANPDTEKIYSIQDYKLNILEIATALEKTEIAELIKSYKQ